MFSKRRVAAVPLVILILSLVTACSLLNSPPVADFFVSPDSGSAPLVVSFDASSSSDTDGIIVAYQWEFGDGTTGSGKVKTHTYELPGEYIARLTVTDDDGAKDLTIQTIQVDQAAITASFVANPTFGESPLSVDFDASGSFDPDGESITYAWSFGDGSTGAGLVASHTYYTAGIYAVLLTVRNETGDEDQATVTIAVSEAPTPGNAKPNAEFTSTPNVGEAPLTVSFDASGSSDSDGHITSYQWTFGDGASGSGAITSHTYDDSGTYEVWLMVADNNGATDTATTTIRATASNVLPVASFLASPTSGEAPLEVSFDASASYDPDGAIVSHGWSFGDGENGSGASATHTYSAAGTYSAQLTVTDDDGVTDSTSRSIQVSPVPNTPPTASFTASPTSGDVPVTVEFDASASSDPDGTVISYEWTFGDGESGSGVTATHVYTNPGSYTALLTVTDDDGSSDSESHSITVSSSVNIVNFPDPGLEAAIRDAIGKPTGDIQDTDLAGLTYLDAIGRSISNLEGIQYCTDLTDLNLANNHIADISAFSGLTSLTRLQMRNNQIVDVSALSGLTNLRDLWLPNNLIADITALSGLTSLTYLDLGYNPIVDISALSGLVNLTRLGMSSNYRIVDIGALSGLTSLTDLDLSWSQIVDISPLSGLTNLTKLDLHNNRIVDIGALSGLTNLTCLILWFNQIIDISPLSSLTSLREISLEHNQIVDVSALSGLTNVTTLQLHYNQISDLQALVDNAGLGTGDHLYIQENDLDLTPGSDDMVAIQALEARGINVIY
jgi:PKD repeat protein